MCRRCLCGSGKEYEKCCMEKINPFSNEITLRQHMAELNKLRNNYKKICMYPVQSECSQQMTGSHTISRQSVLSLICDNNEVLMPIIDGFKHELELRRLGIKTQASTFHCFCSFHDNKLFEEIDSLNVTFNDKTSFLYAYRTFASTYYKVQKEYDIYKKLEIKYDYNSRPDIVLFYTEAKTSLIIMNCIKQIFEDGIIKNRYNELKSIYINLDYKVNFSVSSCFNLMYDLMGNRIIYGEYDMPMVYITIVPKEKSSTIIISWFEKDNIFYKFFEKQVDMVPIKFLLKYLNNLLSLNCENMVINPKLYEAWTEEQQKDFLKIQNRHYDDKQYKSHNDVYYETREFNLFQKI